MSARAEYGVGVLFGTFAAGPVFAMAVVLSHGDYRHNVDLSELVILPALMAMALPVGTILGILPVLFGTVLMASLGRDNEGARLPLLWALAGGFMAGFPAWLMDGETAVITSFAITGTVCALVARWQTRWVEAELAPRYGRA